MRLLNVFEKKCEMVTGLDVAKVGVQNYFYFRGNFNDYVA